MLAIDATDLARPYLGRNVPGDRERAKKFFSLVQPLAEEMLIPVRNTISRMLADLATLPPLANPPSQFVPAAASTNHDQVRRPSYGVQERSSPVPLSPSSGYSAGMGSLRKLDAFDTQPAAARQVKLFYCYAAEDKKLADELAKHLACQKKLIWWHPGKIDAGAPREQSIDEELEAAEIILLLMSVNFLSSQHRYERIADRAMERHKQDKVPVIPILLGPHTPTDNGLETLLSLPRNGKPLSTRKDRGGVWVEIIEEILTIAEKLTPAPTAAQDPTDQASVLPVALALSPAAVEIQPLIEKMFPRENDLRGFCAQFPAVSRLLVKGMSQRECVKLLLTRVDPDEIHDQLKQNDAERHRRYCRLCAEAVNHDS